MTCPICGTELKDIAAIMIDGGADVSDADGLPPHYWCPNCGALVYEIVNGIKIERPRYVDRG